MQDFFDAAAGFAVCFKGKPSFEMQAGELSPRPLSHRTILNQSLTHDLLVCETQNMFDGREDTCWNSEQGSPQFILLDFTRRVRVTGIKFAFQGGFAGAEWCVYH